MCSMEPTLSIEAQRPANFPRRLRVDLSRGQRRHPIADPDHGVAALAAPGFDPEREPSGSGLIPKLGDEAVPLRHGVPLSAIAQPRTKLPETQGVDGPRVLVTPTVGLSGFGVPSSDRIPSEHVAGALERIERSF